MISPKIVLTDIDGVWTDGGMYYDNLGNELKRQPLGLVQSIYYSFKKVWRSRRARQ